MLLFCTMTRALDVLEDYLAWRGFPALRLDGSTGAADRGELVRRFNDPGGWPEWECLLWAAALRQAGECRPARPPKPCESVGSQSCGFS